MIKERKNSVIWLILLGLLVFLDTLGEGIYYIIGLETSPSFDFLYRAGLLSGVIWFLRSDPKRSEAQRVYCPGLLASVGWFIILPYHLLKSRGVKGLIPLLALIGIYFLALIPVVLLTFP